MKHKTVLSFNELRDEYINEIRPRTANQKKYWDMLADDSKSIVIAHGPAGCGKTLLATQNGIDLMKLQKIEKIVNKKNISRKECILLPFKSLRKAIQN